MKSIKFKYKDKIYKSAWNLIQQLVEDENIILNNEEQTARNEAFYDSILNKMLDLLEKMDETNYDYKELDLKEISEKQEEAKNKFFELFSKYFYALWD